MFEEKACSNPQRDYYTINARNGKGYKARSVFSRRLALTCKRKEGCPETDREIRFRGSLASVYCTSRSDSRSIHVLDADPFGANVKLFGRQVDDADRLFLFEFVAKHNNLKLRIDLVHDRVVELLEQLLLQACNP